MNSQLMADKIKWLLFLLGMVQADYLKSTANIKVLEDKTCYLLWDAYTKQQSDAPCQWWYAHDKAEESLVFLAYDGVRRFEYSDHQSQWQFTNIENPCSGGLHKKAKLEDAGVYSMQTEKGILQKKDSEITVEVFKGSDFTFSVYVNGKVTDFDLSEHTQTLDVLETHSPVNVSVVLSKTFPSTTVVRISNGEEVSCDDPHKECYQITDLSDTTDVSISIKIETEIIGATEVLITQPLAYSTLVDNRSRNVFAVLFFILLIILIIIIILFCLQNKRKASKKADKEGKIEQEEKLCMKQHFKNIRSDIVMAFRGKNQLAPDKVQRILQQLESDIFRLQEELITHREKINAEKLLPECQKMLDKMRDTINDMEKTKESAKLTQVEHDQYEVLKLQIKLVTEIKTRLNYITNCCNRCDNEKPGIEVAEEAIEETGMIPNTIGDIPEQLKKIVDLSCEKEKLKYNLQEIEHIKGCGMGTSDAEKEIENISDHFEKIYRGWIYQQQGASIDPDKTPCQGRKERKTKKKKPG